MIARAGGRRAANGGQPVAAGVGVTLVPAPVRDLRRVGVRHLELREPSPTVTLTLAYRADETSPLLPPLLAIARTDI